MPGTIIAQRDRKGNKKKETSIFHPCHAGNIFLKIQVAWQFFFKLGHYCQFFAIKNKFGMNKHFHYTVLDGISQPTKKQH